MHKFSPILCLIAALGLQAGAVMAQNSRASFVEWQVGFRDTALVAGISEQTVDAAFHGVKYTPHIGKAFSNQAEFVRPVWDYLDDLVSPRNIAAGKAMAAELSGLLQEIENEYGIPPSILLAI